MTTISSAAYHADEVWQHIALQSTIPTIGRLAQVSRRFHNICTDWYLWKQLFFLHHPEIKRNDCLRNSADNNDYYAIFKAFHSNWELLNTYSKVHSDQILHGCWSPNGKYFASVSRDHFAMIFQLEHILKRNSEEYLNKIEHSADTGRVGFSGDSKYLMTSTVSEITRLYNLRSFIYLTRVGDSKKLYQLPNACFDAFPCWLPNSRLLFNSDLSFFSPENELFSQIFTAVNVNFSQNNDTEHSDNPIEEQIHNPTTDFQFKLENEYNHFHLSAISPNGNVFVSMFMKNYFYYFKLIYAFKTKKLLQELLLQL